MWARGVVALSMLAVAMACGGRTLSTDNELTGTSGSATGGSSATGGKTHGSAPTAGTGPCLCLGVFCSVGSKWVPDPSVCCGGECVLACDDVACSDVDLTCRPGKHVGLLADECCPQCVPDAPPSCDLAMQAYREFRIERLTKYQSAGCQDSGCALFSESNRCASTCGAPIASAFRDAIEEELSVFAEQTCSQCPKQFPNPCPSAPPFSCIDNSCQAQPKGAQ